MEITNDDRAWLRRLANDIEYLIENEADETNKIYLTVSLATDIIISIREIIEKK